MLWNNSAALQLEGTWGVYPKGFLEWSYRQLRCAPCEVLHVCSGSLGPGVPGIRVDLRREVLPDIVADGRRLPFADGSFGGVLIDPPYSVEYAESLYQTDYPRPSHLLREAARVTRPSGFVAILHFLVPAPPRGARLVRVEGLTQGCGYRIRAFTLYQLEQQALPFP